MSLYPADFVELYRREGLWLDETFATFFADAANRFSDAEAVVGPDHTGVEHRLTYRELEDYSAQESWPHMVLARGISWWYSCPTSWNT